MEVALPYAFSRYDGDSSCGLSYQTGYIVSSDKGIFHVSGGQKMCAANGDYILKRFLRIFYTVKGPVESNAIVAVDSVPKSVSAR